MPLLYERACSHGDWSGRYNTELLDKVYHDLENAPLSEKMKALLVIGSKVQEIGKAVLPEHVNRAKKAGATDTEIHDTVFIAACSVFITAMSMAWERIARKIRLLSKTGRKTGYHWLRQTEGRAGKSW